jgi:T5SS/PEP-CTERM-associated repeat protein
VGYGNSGGAILGTSSTLSVTNGGNFTASNQLYVGAYTSATSESQACSLQVSDGGIVNCGSFSLGYGDAADNTESCYNKAVVSGGISVLACTGTLEVGLYGCNNTLEISNAATVSSASGSVGWGAGDFGAVDYATGGNNSVSLDGTATTWTVSGSVNVGRAGDGNALSVTSGAALSCATFLVGGGYVASDGKADHGTGNAATIDGDGTKLTISGVLYASERGYDNTMTISGGADVACLACFVGYGNRADSTTGWYPCTDGSPLGANNQLTVEGEGTTLTCTDSFSAGTYGSSNKLSVLDGAVVSSGGTGGSSAYIGEGLRSDATTGCDNSVTVSGEGSEWTCTGAFIIGYYGSGNSLLVSDGGKVTTGGDAHSSNLGMNTYSDTGLGSGNSATVSGYNSVWTCTGDLYVGFNGSDNTLYAVNGGAVVVNGSLGVGAIESATGNKLRLGKGFLILKGDKTDAVAALITANKFEVWNATADSGAGAWIAGTSANVTVTYCADEASAKAATAMGTFAGYDGLAGYTIVTGGNQYASTAWASPDAVGGQWYASSWYGTFFSEWCSQAGVSDTGWIWHATHGWQYVYPESTKNAVYVWDCALGSWLYTNSTIYPFIFQYKKESGVWGGEWYKYVGGSEPDRTFWDYSIDGEVTESTLVPAE